MAAEVWKHRVSDLKFSELGWVSRGAETQSTISRLASHLAMQLHCSKSKAITSVYQCLNITLIRAHPRALLSSSGFLSQSQSQGGL